MRPQRRSILSVNSSKAGCVEPPPVSVTRLRSMVMPASITTDLAASSGLPVSSFRTTASVSSLSARRGNKTLAISSDIRITPAAIAIIRSRWGNSEPSPRYRGMENAPAKVTAPRTPEMEVISWDLSGERSPLSRRLSKIEYMYIQRKRSPMSSAVMTRT
ncbi:hypothetical protein D3C79_845570 [compost metagenome]